LIVIAASLSEDDLDRFERLIETRSGIVFNEKNRPLLGDALAAAMKASLSQNPEELLAKIVDPHDTSALEVVVSTLTPGETYFFRNRPHFDALEKHILPALVERRSNAKCLRIWSAGCSTGEEAYSIAIVLHRVIADIDKWNVTVLGTDINVDALSAAGRGVYSEWSFRGSTDDFRTRYFDRVENGWLLKDHLRRIVTLTSHNLMTDPYPSYETNTAAMDVIFCRNVTIYFNKTVTRRITSQFYDALLDGGWLFAGHAESSDFIDSRFTTATFPDAVAHRKNVSRGHAVKIGHPSANHSNGPAKNGQSPQRAGAMAAPPAPRGVRKPHELATADASGGREKLAPARVLLQQARKALEIGQLAGARKLAHQAIEKNALLAEAHYILGVVCDREADPEGALQHLRKCLCVDRLFLPGHLAMAEVLLRIGRKPEARRALENVVGSAANPPPSGTLLRGLRENPVNLRERALSLLSRCASPDDEQGKGDESD